ncbi:cysteine dioxygenase [Amycolatopsis rhizosphaerae]|uniref:Cysteine dioxygenase n=1 Tax=Amycolatopsis rhizosphaerae TaxID=2053003 RepID=A0A558BTT7_9PSEU|nr:cysteine dioxygenase family protein [Amycolatopsis rhizosphaerae]TVT39934.1 cysteine dioxygenase [Amycolatopsis rhizosphaerae]
MTSTIVDIDLHPRLETCGAREFLDSRRPQWTAGELRALTAALAGELAAGLPELVRYVPGQRWWTRLALTPGVEVWLLSWLPGQGTRPHDHGGASGAFTVLTGRLTETYRYPSRRIRVAERETGASTGFGPGRAHIVRNTFDTPAASVHAYSPPLLPTREYASLGDLPDAA